MNLNDLALFTCVVERGSFTAAAKLLGVPKSSVTRGIARLERELNVRLIQRTTRQRDVTDAGRELFEHIRGPVAALEDATEAVRERDREPAGLVRVTAFPDAWMMGVPEVIADLRTRWPRIHVDLQLTARVVDLVADRVDLALRAGKLADSSLIAKRIGTTNAGLFASKAYLKRRGKPTKLGDLAGHDCVLFRGHDGRATWALEGPRGHRVVEVTGVASVDELWFSAKLIEADLGIGMLPMFVAHRHDGFERVLPRHTIAGAPLHVVMPTTSYLPARVTVVRDALVDHLSRTLSACDRHAALPDR